MLKLEMPRAEAWNFLASRCKATCSLWPQRHAQKVNSLDPVTFFLAVKAFQFAYSARWEQFPTLLIKVEATAHCHEGWVLLSLAGHS